MECSKCGAVNVRLFDVITGEGIIKLCQYCLSEEDAPVVKKPTVSQFQSVNKEPSVYERLSKSAGLDASEHKKHIFGSEQQKQLKEQEGTLRDLVDRRYDRSPKEKPKKRDDLIDNFHWIVMRARRNKKMTMTQFAKAIGESERMVKMIEQGILPEGGGDYGLIRKIEAILSINLVKPEFLPKLDHKKQLGFDEFSSKSLTIADLHEMKKETNENVPAKEPYWRRLMGAFTRKKEETPELPESPASPEDNESELELGELKETPIEFNNTSLEIIEQIHEAELEEQEESNKKPEDLSDKDINDLIFGRKK